MKLLIECSSISFILWTRTECTLIIYSKYLELCGAIKDSWHDGILEEDCSIIPLIIQLLMHQTTPHENPWRQIGRYHGVMNAGLRRPDPDVRWQAFLVIVRRRKWEWDHRQRGGPPLGTTVLVGHRGAQHVSCQRRHVERFGTIVVVVVVDILMMMIRGWQRGRSGEIYRRRNVVFVLVEEDVGEVAVSGGGRHRHFVLYVGRGEGVHIREVCLIGRVILKAAIGSRCNFRVLIRE